MASGTFTRLTSTLQRSSHSLSVVGGKAYLFGGEIDPRRPVDNDVYALDLAGGGIEAIKGAAGAPEARVGHVAGVIGGVVYVFGGRGGPAMTPLEENGAVHAFDPSTRAWSTLSPSSASFPSARSYHCATTSSSRLIVHGGCPSSGPRLADVWAFEPATRAWTRLADAPGIGRGGAALAFSGDTLYRFGGFNGTTEVGGQIDALRLGDAQAGWTSAVFGATEGLGRGEHGQGELAGSDAGPGPRSVTALHAVGDRIALLFGEGKPSPTGGHDAAGNFWDDVWVYAPSDGAWARVAAPGEWPAPRGWFASDAVADGVVFHGGLDARNERLGDAWVLRLQ
ncbi:Nitrile-specifier protein 5 [Vanrija pseudolonga]|uniref:Nitrile-specifier protein 5 n=1 Tax=Vanrija pseudolonga TaxID=143232 RepID=A0AAF0Y8H2_9TREE|nr:Nitrile-specifier protein 5 [Vanrija pseudolonga]